MKNMFSFLGNPPFRTFEDQIVSIFKPAPSLPDYFAGGLVQYAPVIALIFGLIGAFSSLLYMRFVTLFGGIYFFSSLTAAILLVLSFGELKSRTITGWRMVFWSANVSILASLVRLDALAVVVVSLVSWYLLAHIHSRYS